MRPGDTTRLAIGGLLLLASFVVVRTPGNQAAARTLLEQRCAAQGTPAANCACAASATVAELGWLPFVPFAGYDDALRRATLPDGAWPRAMARCTAGR